MWEESEKRGKKEEAKENKKRYDTAAQIVSSLQSQVASIQKRLLQDQIDSEKEDLKGKKSFISFIFLYYLLLLYFYHYIFILIM